MKNKMISILKETTFLDIETIKEIVDGYVYQFDSINEIDLKDFELFVDELI